MWLETESVRGCLRCSHGPMGLQSVGPRDSPRGSAPAMKSVGPGQLRPLGSLSNPGRMLRGGALAALALGWAAAWLWRRGFDPRAWLEGEAGAVWSAAELRRHAGTEASAGLCLAVLGQVFDVRRGRKHYGPGGAYSFFAGACKDGGVPPPFRDLGGLGIMGDVVPKEPWAEPPLLN